MSGQLQSKLHFRIASHLWRVEQLSKPWRGPAVTGTCPSGCSVTHVILSLYICHRPHGAL
jgi:hypothetical protein